MSSCLIISAAINFDAVDLRVFLRSAARHVPHATILLFSDNVDAAFENELAADNPNVRLARPPGAARRRRMWRNKRTINRIRARPSLLARFDSVLLKTPFWPYASAPLHVVMARHFWTQWALRQPFTRGFEQVLLADSSDICLQADPFDPIEDCLITGPSGLAFRDWPEALNWYRRHYSEALARTLEERPMLVAGITLGPRSLIEAYADSMTREIATMAPLLFGLSGDQFLHNALLHGSSRIPINVSRIDEGVMAHLLKANPDDFIFDEDVLKTRSGKTIAMVHHYLHSRALSEKLVLDYEIGRKRKKRSGRGHALHVKGPLDLLDSSRAKKPFIEKRDAR